MVLISISYADDIVAIVTEIEGHAYYQKDDDTVNFQLLQVNMPLFKEDKIHLEKDTRIRLLFSMGKCETVKGEMIYVVPEVPPKELSIKSALLKLWKSIIGKFRRTYSGEKMKNYPGIRGEDLVFLPGEIMSPVGKVLPTAELVFDWITDGSQVSFDIILLRNDSQIMQVKGVKPGYAIQDSNIHFEKGIKYSWILKTLMAMEIQILDTAEFEIISDDEQERIEIQLAEIESVYSNEPECLSRVLIEAILFEEMGLYYNALLTYKEYVEKSDSSIEAVLLLTDLYFKLGFPELVKKELLNADGLPFELMNSWKLLNKDMIEMKDGK